MYKEHNMPTTKVSKETLTELKKQIVTFEKENNTRDVVGRRLWNYLKANNGEQHLEGGARKRLNNISKLSELANKYYGVQKKRAKQILQTWHQIRDEEDRDKLDQLRRKYDYKLPKYGYKLIKFFLMNFQNVFTDRSGNRYFPNGRLYREQTWVPGWPSLEYRDSKGRYLHRGDKSMRHFYDDVAMGVKVLSNMMVFLETRPEFLYTYFNSGGQGKLLEDIKAVVKPPKTPEEIMRARRVAKDRKAN